MKIYDVINEKRGDTVSPSRYKKLYHLCDHHGFSHTIDADELKSRGNYVSTTWDSSMNNVVGKSHYDFKFVIDAPSLVNEYGAFDYDDHGYYGNVRQSHNEREVGIDTRSIKNISKYLKGTILLFDLFSEKGAQWLLYENKTHDSMFGPRNDNAPQAIYTIFKHLYEHNLPLWKLNEGNKLTSREHQFIKDVKEIADKKLPFHNSLEEISDKYMLSDHWGKKTDKETFVRRHMSSKFVDIINKYYDGKHPSELDMTELKNIITRIVKAMRFGNNYETVVLGMLEDGGMYNPIIEAVSWGSIITCMMDGDPNELKSLIEYMKKRYKNKIEDYEKNSYRYKHYTHQGTSFGRRLIR